MYWKVLILWVCPFRIIFCSALPGCEPGYNDWVIFNWSGLSVKFIQLCLNKEYSMYITVCSFYLPFLFPSAFTQPFRSMPRSINTVANSWLRDVWPKQIVFHSIISQVMATRFLNWIWWISVWCCFGCIRKLIMATDSKISISWGLSSNFDSHQELNSPISVTNAVSLERGADGCLFTEFFLTHLLTNHIISNCYLNNWPIPINHIP